MTHMTPDTTLVIGAGLSGLATARALADRGLPVTVLEAREQVAHPWRTRHPALRLNIHRKFAGLPGQEAPKSDSVYLRRDTVIGHIGRADPERTAQMSYRLRKRRRGIPAVATNEKIRAEVRSRPISAR